MRMFPGRSADLIRLALPIAGIQFSQVALTSVDLLMMGLISIQAVAAGGLALLLYNQLRTMSVGMVTGLGNRIAQALGRGEKRTGSQHHDAEARAEVQELLRAGLALATGVALVAAMVLVALSHALPWLGQSEAVSALARPIMLTLAPGLLPMLWFNVLRQFAIGLRRAGSLLGITLVSVAVNALLNAVFIYGWLGLPQLGLAGIGLSTTLVQVFSLVSYIIILRRDPVMARLVTFSVFGVRAATLKGLFGLGAPIALTYGSEAAITSLATLFMGTFGPVALAASNVVNQLAYIAYQLNIGLSQAASILVSRARGKEEHGEVMDIARRALAISAAAMTLVALSYVMAPEPLLRLFLGPRASDEALAVAGVLLWFAIVHQYAKGAQNILVGLLRGLGNTQSGLVMTLIGYWLIGIPAMALFAYGLKWGGEGVWLGLCIGFTAAALLLWRRFVADAARL